MSCQNILLDTHWNIPIFFITLHKYARFDNLSPKVLLNYQENNDVQR